MLRKLTACVTAMAVPIGAACALFVHAHLDAHESAHHDGHAVHAHLSAHASAHAGDGPVLGHDESEDAVAVDLFVAESPDIVRALPLPSATFVLSAPSTPAPRSAPRVSHGHDPPVLGLLAPRPPPDSRL